MLARRIIRHSKETSKALVVVLAAALLGTGFAVMETASPANASACSTTATSFGGGDGTSVAPFQISSKEHLVLLSTSTDVWRENYHFIQTADIDLGGCEWAPIGNQSNVFTGTYNGGFYSITGLSITSASTGERLGLFGKISETTIRELTVAGSITTNRSNVGGLVGEVPQFQTSQITKVRSEVNITYSGGNYAGGLVGSMYHPSTISFSIYSGNFVATNGTVGAMTGWSSSGGSTPHVISSYARPIFSGTSSHKGGMNSWNTPSISKSYSVAPGANYGITNAGVGSSTTGNFWDAEVGPSIANLPSTITVTQAAGKTTAQMKDISTYQAASWDIVSGWEPFSDSGTLKIWGICSLVNDGYPFLLWEYTTDPCTVTPPPSNSGSGSSSGSVVVAPIVVPEAVVAPGTIRQPTIRQATDNRPARLLGKSLNKDVLFFADSARLTPEARKSLRQAARLAMASDGKVAVTGFAAMTNRGSAYERSVALKRARAVARFLRAQGFDDWIYYHGLSGRQGQAFEGNPRRVEIRILN